MKNISLMLLLILCIQSRGLSQLNVINNNYTTPGADIIYVEYFIDSDPGLGLGTSIAVSPNPGQDVMFTGGINVNSLSAGIHVLHVRAKDADGKWSLMQSNIFYKDVDILFGNYQTPGPDIIYVEYFVDTDPGLGMATMIPVTPGMDVSLTATLCVNGLTAGDHYLHTRAQDADGLWSLMQVDTFTIQSACHIFDGIQVNTICDDNNTSDVWSDDTFSFELTAIGINSASTYTISGDATGTGTFDCDNPSVFNNGGAGYPTSMGDLTITLADDNDPTNCTRTITIPAPIPDALNCSNISITLDATGNATIAPSDIHTGNTCGVLSITIDQSSFDCTDVGTQPVNLTMTDVNNNVTNCMVVVTVSDNIVPSMQCQDITIQLDALGMASIIPADVDNASNDNCGTVSLALSQSTFTCSDLGNNSVTLIGTDPYTNQASCLSNVTVQDMMPPTILCQDITIQLDALGMASIIPADVDNASSDNCGTVSLALSQSTFSCSDIGTNSITLTGTDPNGNQASCTVMVTVDDPGYACCYSVLSLNTNPIINNTYKVYNHINSKGTVPPTGIVTYEAQDSIVLKPDFEVKLGALFEALIKVCID